MRCLVTGSFKKGSSQVSEVERSALDGLTESNASCTGGEMGITGRVLLILASIACAPAFAEEAGGSGGVPDASTTLNKKKAPPAPLGIFGSDIAAVGKFSVAFSGVFTGLANSRIGTRIVSPEYIVSTTPWFFDPAKTVRLVPSSVFATIQTLSVSGRREFGDRLGGGSG
jgi:hypothetical protein